LSETIAPASRQDLAEILKIYNEVIRTSTAVYTEIEFTAERGAAWFDAKRSAGFPFIVAKDASGITGFGTFGEFRAPRCYQRTAWNTAFMFAPTGEVRALADSC
jgi:phosphinothricin acetyltransferase